MPRGHLGILHRLKRHGSALVLAQHATASLRRVGGCGPWLQSTATAQDRHGVGRAGTSRALGRPAIVIVISSPASTPPYQVRGVLTEFAQPYSSHASRAARALVAVP